MDTNMSFISFAPREGHAVIGYGGYLGHNNNLGANAAAQDSIWTVMTETQGIIGRHCHRPFCLNPAGVTGSDSTQSQPEFNSRTWCDNIRDPQSS